ncbi:RNA-binding domain-containing protein [Holdemanella porci]|mgnify:FL=1|jgi:ATP-dependent DNA helicase RecG|uniref:AAA family ATPase n=1 Tax=Holdemanella porci TaxID=2652276 RepID=A0A6N7VFK6_9FIRM|nr:MULTISPECIES: RNA-binding domain-containing protein [Bacillota]RGJ65527.1 AAA family ATPase [Eubacterium sp. TM05-53]MCI7166602.1 putative DNA binding domain-containing protein [Holdemanella sp.]MDY4127781.1 ATP-binding protein [Peptostreptococcus porci]MDY5474638.1 ATP-binding protein [Holdemanella porci]MSS56497.1 AAA family ATPase [Holdemanella porci]
MRETRILEFKETITNTFLKTVSAFSNYDGGEILFGVDDDGNIKGLSDVKQACLDIENKINDSISPQPNYTLEIQNNEQTIKLSVKSGLQKPYLYKSKAYKRNDTATIEVDTLEFSRLVLEGKNIRFEELPCKDQELSFEILQSNLKEKIQIETFNKDTLKTLNLYDDANGFNNAAGLLADKNHFPGIDIVKFGENISIIQKRITFENTSVLGIYEKALSVFRDYYQYEVIQGADRKMVEKIPEAAFREAIANALIHRVWDVDSQIRVSMFDDRTEVVSPGGLPSGITEDEYLSGKLSVLRNRNLANVFYRLGFVEIFGTGITRIKQIYSEASVKPSFEVSENAIQIVLPIYEENANLTEDEKVVYKLLSKNMLKSMSEIAPYISFGKSKTTKLLKDMEQKGVITIEGKGKGTKYRIK